MWMRDRQNSYSDEMISFWPLLHPLTEWRRDGYQASCTSFAVHLAMVCCHTHRVLPSCPKQHGDWAMAAPGQRGKKGNLWTEAYACCLQWVAEASTRHSWETKGEEMVPQVSPLVQAFLTTTGRSVSPSSVRECWLSKNDIVPRQPMNIVRARITHCLDKVAMQSPSTIACSRGWNRTRVFGKKIAFPIHLDRRWILALRCRGAFEATRSGRKVPGSGQSPQIWRTYARLRSTNQWCGMGCNERCPFFAHRGWSAIRRWLGKLLFCAVRSTGRSTDHPVTPRRNYCRLWTIENWNAKTDGGRHGCTTSIGTQMMHRTDHTHPAFLRVLAKSRWVSPRKTHLPLGKICALCQNVSLNLGQCRPRKTYQKEGRTSHKMMMSLRMNSSPNSCLKVISSTCSRVWRNCSPLHNHRVDVTMEWFSIKSGYKRIMLNVLYFRILRFLSKVLVKNNKAVGRLFKWGRFKIRGGGCDMRDAIFLFFG